jgi:hypothetical protein
LNRVTRRRIFGVAAGSLAAAAGARPSEAGFTFPYHFINLLLSQLQHGSRGTHVDLLILQLLLQVAYLVVVYFALALHGRFPHTSILTGRGELGPTTGGAKVDFTSPEVRALSEQIYRDGLAHVRLIRGTLKRYGVEPAAKPAINLNGTGAGFPGEAEFLSSIHSIITVILALFLLLLPLLSNPHILRIISRLLGGYGTYSGALGTHAATAGATVPALDGKSTAPTLEAQLPTDADGMLGERTVEEAIAALAPYFPQGLNGLSPDKFEQLKRSRA